MPTQSPISLPNRLHNHITALLLLSVILLSITTTALIIKDGTLYPDEISQFQLIVNQDLFPSPDPYEVVVFAPAKKCPLPISMRTPGDPGKAEVDPTYDFMLNDEFFLHRDPETGSIIPTSPIIPCYFSTLASRAASTPVAFFSKTRLASFPAYVHDSRSNPAENDDNPRTFPHQASINPECNINNARERETNTTWSLHHPTCSLQSAPGLRSDTTTGKIVCKTGYDSKNPHQPLKCHQPEPNDHQPPPSQSPSHSLSHPSQPHSPQPQLSAISTEHEEEEEEEEQRPNECSMFLYVLRPVRGDRELTRWLECSAQSPPSREIDTTSTHNNFFAPDYLTKITRQLSPPPAYQRDISFEYIPDVPLNATLTEYANTLSATQNHSQQTLSQFPQQQSLLRQQQSQNESTHLPPSKTEHSEEQHATNNPNEAFATPHPQQHDENTSLRDNYLRALEYDQKYVQQQQQRQEKQQQQHQPNPVSSLTPLQTITSPEPIPEPPPPRIDYLKITFARFPDSTFINFQLAFGIPTQSHFDESSFFSNQLMLWIQSYWSSSLRQNKPYATCGHHGARLLIRESGPQSRMVFTLALSPNPHIKFIFPDVATCTIPIPIQLVHNQLMQNTRRDFPQGWNNQQISVMLRLDEIQGNLLYTWPTTHEKARWNFLDPQLAPFVVPSLTHTLSPSKGHIIITQEFQINGPMPEVSLKRTFPPIHGDVGKKTYIQHLLTPLVESSTAPAGFLAWNYVTTTARNTTDPTYHHLDPELALEGKSLYFEDYHGYVRMTFTVVVALIDLQFFVLEWSINNEPYYTTLVPQLDPTYSISQPNQGVMMIDYNLQFQPSLTVLDATRQFRVTLTFSDKEHFRASLEAIPFAFAVQPRLQPFEPNVTEAATCYATTYQKQKDGTIETIDEVPAPSVENPWLHFLSPTQRSSYQVEEIRLNLNRWVTFRCTYKLNIEMIEHWPFPFDTVVDDFSRWSLHHPLLFAQYFEPMTIEEHHSQVQPSHDSLPTHPSTSPVHITTTTHPNQSSPKPQPFTTRRHPLSKHQSRVSNTRPTSSNITLNPPQLQLQQPEQQAASRMATMVNFIYISLLPSDDRDAVELMLDIATSILNTSTFLYKDSMGLTHEVLGLKTFNRDLSTPFDEPDWHFGTDMKTTARVGQGGMGSCIDYPSRMFDNMDNYTPDEINLRSYNTQTLISGRFQHATCFLLSIPFQTDLPPDEAHLLHLKLRNHVFAPFDGDLLHYHSVSPTPTRTGPRVVDLLKFIFPGEEEDSGEEEPSKLKIISKSEPRVRITTPLSDGTISGIEIKPKSNKNPFNVNQPFTLYASSPLPAGAPCFVDGNCLSGDFCVRQRCVYSYLQDNLVTDSDFYMTTISDHKLEHAGLPSKVNAALHSWTPTPPSTSSDVVGKVLVFLAIFILGVGLCVGGFCVYRCIRLSKKKSKLHKDVLMASINSPYNDYDEYWSGSEDDDDQSD